MKFLTVASPNINFGISDQRLYQKGELIECKVSEMFCKKITHYSLWEYNPHANKMSSISHFSERGIKRDLQYLADIILLDHSYAKPWSAHPDASKVRPVKTLFLPREDVEKLSVTQPRAEDDIDVCEPAASSCNASIMYDTAKAKAVMAECEKYVSTVSSKKTPDTWEEQISR